jgi:hypothetical protein
MISLLHSVSNVVTIQSFNVGIQDISISAVKLLRESWLVQLLAFPKLSGKGITSIISVSPEIERIGFAKRAE